MAEQSRVMKFDPILYINGSIGMIVSVRKFILKLFFYTC